MLTLLANVDIEVEVGIFDNDEWPKSLCRAWASVINENEFIFDSE